MTQTPPPNPTQDTLGPRNRRNLELSWVERRLLFLSKTDLHALQFCTEETQNTQTSIGAMVLITGILAFASAYFAVSSTLMRGYESPLYTLFALLIALIYSAAIMTFDREVVSATDKKAIWLRVPFAILIGFVISAPMELKLQQDRIDAQITQSAEQRNAEKIKVIREFGTRMEAAISKDLGHFQGMIDTANQAYQNALEQYRRECAQVACRGEAEKRRLEMDKAAEFLKAAKAEYEREKPRILAAIQQRFADEKREVDKLQAQITQEKQGHDFLTQFEALHEIRQNSSTALWTGLILMGFFISFEMFPVLIKLFLPYTEYHAYLDARRRIQVNKIIGVTNFADAFIRQELSRKDANIEEIRRMLSETEITDILEEIMEDRQLDFYDKPNQNGNNRSAGTESAGTRPEA